MPLCDGMDRSVPSYTLESLPTILRSGPYRLFFYSEDQYEPPHVHVEREELQAKFWLDPVRFEWNRGFRRPEIRQVEKMVTENVGFLMEAWYEYFRH